MNRGIARRPIFEDPTCARYLLSRIARQVRMGTIEIHAYSLMPTHFHLLVRSPVAGLSEAMRRITNHYVRWFNRRYKRDGPLFRGRFTSKPVESLRYQQTLIEYIDANPVTARIVAKAADYPHGSAAHYQNSSGPAWLSRSWVEADAMQRTLSKEFSSQAYARAFGPESGISNPGLVEARMRHSRHAPDPLDDLIKSSPASVGLWLQRKTKLADGTSLGLPCASPRRVMNAFQSARTEKPTWAMQPYEQDQDPWSIPLVGLLRDLACLGWPNIYDMLGAGESATRRRYRTHRSWLQELPDYRAMAGELASNCLA